MDLFLANFGQWLGMCLLLVGVIVEVYTGADVGYMAITIGSAVFAIWTKIKYYVIDQDKKKGKEPQ